MNTQADLIEWLRNAYAMEKAQETALHKLAVYPHTHPALRHQAALHCNVTRQHAAALAHCLKRLGSETSSLRTVLAQGMDLTRGVGAAFARDERIKEVLTVFVTEHFEISCHTILRTGAARLGLTDIVRTCDKILTEEKRMVEWLELHLPQIIASYLSPVEETREDEELKEDVFDLAESTSGWRIAQWEFAQLAQNTPLFGGSAPRPVFASMLS
ncbi:DUF892 family protein [Prosthecobacter sp.]|uniref:DUF892 family protein n=1 Tax=Prosthecobacter sp. TaxID=1965333 RepID=UPI0037851A72